MNTVKKKNSMLESIFKEFGDKSIFEILSETSFRRLIPVLLNAWKKRVQRKTPMNILDVYEKKYQFFGISSIPQTKLFEFAQLCFSAIPNFFDIVEVSPISPLGLNSVLSNISQNNVLSTIRDAEVVGDITSQLALECAYRRKKIIVNDRIEHLCSSHRVLRMQPFDKNKGYMQHFNLLGLCSGGRSSETNTFATTWIREHISIILEMMFSLKKIGLSFSNVSVNLSDIRFLEHLIKSLSLPKVKINRHSLDDDFNLFQVFDVEFPKKVESVSELSKKDFDYCGLDDKRTYYSHLENEIIIPLRRKYPFIRFCFDFTRKSGLGYYKHICFKVFATTPNGNRIQVSDGGVVDWLEKILQNKKEAMVISGIGSELTHKLFGLQK